MQCREREIRRDNLADEERNQANRERNRASIRARIQTRWIILQIQHQFRGTDETTAVVTDFLSYLTEYGE